MSKKYNILLLNETSGPGGAETVLFNIVKNLDRSQYSPRVVLFRQGWFYHFLVENGIATDVIESRRSWDLRFLLSLIKYCRLNKIDLIHAHLPGGNLYGSVVGKILGLPVICTFHNEYAMPGASRRFDGVKNFLIRNLASKLVMVAEYMKQEYLDNAKFPSDKIITIYNGVSDEEPKEPFDIIAFKTEIDFCEGDLLIANVANFRPPKGHLVLIEAAYEVCQAIPKAKFLLIGEEGDGKIIGEILERIGKHNLQDRIKLLGFRNDISQILRNIDIFLLASISEGLPMSVVEAMRASRPVVATNVGGLPEVVKSGVTGFLANPGDHHDLAEKLITLLKDQKLRKEMAEKGREVAISMFSLDEMISKYQALYKRLLE
jgi:glycosyltransferase involved in cell wall biosynthesis